MDRRSFIGGSALALAGVISPPMASAKPVSVMPFLETRGGRSAKEPIETKSIASHAIERTYEDLDELTIHKAKQRILDLIGCAIGGVHASGNEALATLMQSYGGSPQATIIGYPGKKVASAQAAMVNAIIARSYDFEAMYVVADDKVSGSHNSATTIMTALSLCERYQRNGRELLTSVVVGDDISARILTASGFTYASGWDGSGVFGTLGATAIAARQVGLDVRQAMYAMGIAVDTISGTVQHDWDGSTTWKFPQGLAAYHGVLSAELAKGGWSGMGDALLAPYGFYAQFTEGCERPEYLTQGLGKNYYAEEYFKPYPSCAATHSSHECALTLKAEHLFEPQAIKQVIVRLPAFSLTSALTQKFDAGSDPHGSANFSIPYQVANAFLRGKTRQEHYSNEAIFAPEMTALMDKISFEPLLEGTSGVVIEVTLNDGRTLTGTHIGTPSRNPTLQPSTQEEIEDKFRQQVAFSKIIDQSRGEQVIRRVNKLEKEQNIADLIKLLS